MKLKTNVDGYGHITVKFDEKDRSIVGIIMVPEWDEPKVSFLLDRTEVNNLVTALNAVWGSIDSKERRTK